MSDLDVLWADLENIFPIANGVTIPVESVNHEVYQNVCQRLSDLGILETVAATTGLEIESATRHSIASKFWKHFSVKDEHMMLSNDLTPSGEALTNQSAHFVKFVEAINELHDGYLFMLEMKLRIKRISKSSSLDIEEDDKFTFFFRDALLSQMPPNFNVIVQQFYSLHFRIFTRSISHQAATDSDTLGDLPCSGCNFEGDQCCCQRYAEMANVTNTKLFDMGMIDRLAGSSMTALIQVKIKDHINDTCLGIFDRSHLKQLFKWLNDVIMPWLINIFTGGKHTDNDSISDLKSLPSLHSFKVKLTYFIYETFAQSVISQFFSIIIDYPDSTPAIDDLKICMEKIDMRVYLIKSLRSSLEARILHPGVNTMDILTGYVAAIKAIRHLDNTGVILEMVTAPIKNYLKKRNDTVRRVVTGLTEEGPTDLSEELAKGEFNKDDVNFGLDVTSNWENWEPDPFGIDPNLRHNTSKIIRSADIISMVVDIYGSKELFMVEYRNLMADRLLAHLDFNAEKEIRNLELLKIRFGESLLHSCEVMLKDVNDSKRINSHIHGDSNSNKSQFAISSLIISAQFWPSFNKESLQLPDEIEIEFKKYTKAYEAYKGNRTLNWRTVTGRVNIVIEIGDQTIEMTVAPTQAVIIYHFQEKYEWTLEDLSALMKVPPSALRRRIHFWQNHGLIAETQSGVFSLIEKESAKSQFEDMNVTDADEDLESAMASASDQREEELQVFWSYIVGMLTNLDSMPIDRIHQMLKLFASHNGGVEFTRDELKHFLQRKVREHKLLFSGGVYQLAK